MLLAIYITSVVVSLVIMLFCAKKLDGQVDVEGVILILSTSLVPVFNGYGAVILLTTLNEHTAFMQKKVF